MEAVENTQSQTIQLSKPQKIVRTLGWISLGFFCLIVFTLIKFPDDKIRAHIENQWRPVLAAQGVTVDAQRIDLGYGFGVYYELTKAQIHLNGTPDPIKFSRISLSPSLLQLITGKGAGSATLEQGAGWLKISGAMPLSSKIPSADINFEVKSLNLGEAGLLGLLNGIKGSIPASGEGNFSGELNTPSKWKGHLKLDLKKISLEAQKLQIPIGFIDLPSILVSDGKADINVDAGKVVIKTLTLGKKSSPDDLTLEVTGDAQLGASINASTLNLKARFTLSDKVKAAFGGILDTLLGAAKQADGSYGYQITGPISFPNWTPLSAAK